MLLAAEHADWLAGASKSRVHIWTRQGSLSTAKSTTMHALSIGQHVIGLCLFKCLFVGESTE